jgi:hypothetical protein
VQDCIDAQRKLSRQHLDDADQGAGGHAERGSPTVQWQGYLYKQGMLNRNWKKRWFVLQENSLKYWKSQEAAQRRGAAPVGSILVAGLLVEPDVGSDVTQDQNGQRQLMCFAFTPAFDPSGGGLSHTGLHRRIVCACETAEQRLECTRLLVAASEDCAMGPGSLPQSAASQSPIGFSAEAAAILRGEAQGADSTRIGCEFREWQV